MSDVRIALIDRWLSQRVKRGDTAAVSAVIVEGDQTLLLSTHGRADVEADLEATVNDLVPVGSLTKTFLSVATLLLQRSGALHIDARADDFLERKTGTAEVTIKSLLNHTSGFSSFAGAHVDLDYKLVIDGDPALLAGPGEQSRYSNFGFYLLGKVLEAASGQSLADLLRTLIFEPLEMDSTGFIDEGVTRGYGRRDRSGIRTPIEGARDYVWPAAGGLVSTPDDLSKWARAWTTDALLDADVRKQFFESEQGAPDPRWGLGWLLADAYGRTVGYQGGHLPGFHHGMAVDFETSQVVIVLTNAIEADGEAWTDQALAGLQLELQRESREKFTGIFGNVWNDFAIASTSPTQLVAIDLDSTTPFDEVDVLDITSESELTVTAGTSWSPVGERVKYRFDDSGSPTSIIYAADEVPFMSRL